MRKALRARFLRSTADVLRYLYACRAKNTLSFSPRHETYDYDDFGRVREVGITGPTIYGGITQAYDYDGLGRLTGEENALGEFTYEYDLDAGGNDTTSRMRKVDYPNGTSVNYEYYGEADNAVQEKRLKKVAYKKGVNLISNHEYTYSPTGNITSWVREDGGGTPETLKYEYDLINQLTSARKTGGAPRDYAYLYDETGNRLVEQIDGAGKWKTFNNLNQIETDNSSLAGGLMRFAGDTSKETLVTVDGMPVEQLPGNRFEAWVDVDAGDNDIEIVARDEEFNQRTETYRVNVPASTAQEFTYDEDGNLLSDGVREFTWDAKNQLTRIKYNGTTWTDFTYDGQGRRIIVKETDSSGTTTKHYWWLEGTQPFAECTVDGGGNATIARRYFGQGERVGLGGTRYFYTKDH